jgi:murein DD-endopeptidase MepM/ murein hydrolase activator NlpD
MSTFPLGIAPLVTWHENPTNTHFGAPRGDGFPVHGACDLVAPAGTKVFAVRDGTVIRSYPFVTYCKGTKAETTTWAIDVAHDRFTVRYGEIARELPKGVFAGATVVEGQLIATVGAQCGNAMLHFELFDDPNRIDYLTDKSSHKYLYVPQANYERRNDLLDPTSLLDSWFANRPALPAE